jgi:integrase/recombinase XerC
VTTTTHPDWAPYIRSWQLRLRAERFSPRTQTTYQTGVETLARWLADHDPEVGPLEVAKDHVAAWVGDLNEGHPATTVRLRLSAVKSFMRFLAAEGERANDPAVTVKAPVPGDHDTPILDREQAVQLLDTCTGNTFLARRDRAVLALFLGCGLRLAEVQTLNLEDVADDLGSVSVTGKGRRRGGPRHRAAPLDDTTAAALDAYLRARRKHPHADDPALWLTSGRRGRLSREGMVEIVRRRGRQVGLDGLHPHALRHSWADGFRTAGGEEGDLMVLGGWESRTMLDRYGKAGRNRRAAEAARRHSWLDRTG